MANSVNVFFRDFGAQRVGTGIPVQAAANTAARQAVADGIQLWSIGQDSGVDNVVELEADAGTGATSPAAQSGMYAYMLMKDNVNGKTYRERVPMPDVNKAVDVGLEVAWLTDADSSGNSIAYANPLHADYITLKAAMEAAYISPEGNTAVLTRLYIPNKF